MPVAPTPKIRVLHLLGSPKAGGAELFFIRLMQAFANRPDEIEILPVVKTGSWPAAQLGQRGIRYLTSPYGGLLDRTTATLLKRYAAEFQPNLVMSWMNRASRFMPQPSANAWVTSARLGGYYPLKYYRGNVRELVGNTADIVAYCRSHGWPPERVTQLDNFVVPPSAEWHTQRASLRAATREQLGIPADATVLLIAARLHPVKGYETALAALKQLAQKNVYLVGLGEGPLRRKLLQESKTLGLAARLKLPGWTDDQAPYAAAADLWLVPSHHEPLGNSVLDAWGYGLPLVATATHGPKSLVTDTRDGLLIPADDAPALATAVTRLLDDPELAVSLAVAGRRKLANHFSEEVVVANYLAYYQRLIAENMREHAA